MLILGECSYCYFRGAALSTCPQKFTITKKGPLVKSLQLDREHWHGRRWEKYGLSEPPPPTFVLSVQKAFFLESSTKPVRFCQGLQWRRRLLRWTPWMVSPWWRDRLWWLDIFEKKHRLSQSPQLYQCHAPVVALQVKDCRFLAKILGFIGDEMMFWKWLAWLVEDVYIQCGLVLVSGLLVWNHL